MSSSAVSGVSQINQQSDQPRVTTPSPAQTPFSQQLDAQSTQTGAASGHHHHGHHTQSATSSAATAASAAGGASSGTVASSLLGLLS